MELCIDFSFFRGLIFDQLVVVFVDIVLIKVDYLIDFDLMVVVVKFLGLVEVYDIVWKNFGNLMVEEFVFIIGGEKVL